MCGHIWIVSLPTWRLALAHKIPQGEAQWHRSGTGVAQAEEHQVLRWRSDGAQMACSYACTQLCALSHGLPEVTRSPASQASLCETSKSASPPEVKPSPRARHSSRFNKLRKGKWKRLEKTQLTKAQATTGWRVSKLFQV